MTKTVEDIYLEMCNKRMKQEEEKQECPKCKGDGCSHCDDTGYHTEAKAPKTDKEDDGEGMDPVGHGDSDIDNDGDVDSSDKYLKNRRKAISKSMKEAAGQAIQSMVNKQQQTKGKVMDAILQGSKPDHKSLPVDVDDTEEKGHDDSTKVADKVKSRAGLRRGDSKLGDAFKAVTQKEEVKLDEADQYVVMDRKTGKAVTKPMKMQQALDAYDGRGGNAKGLAVVKTTDKRLKEEVELGENYSKKSTESLQKIYDKYKDEKMTPAMANEFKAIRRELKKRGAMKEEVDQVDELKKSTLASYTRKATSDAAMSAHNAGYMSGDKRKKAMDRANKRIKGVNRAVDKLTREEVELDEAVTDQEMIKIHKDLMKKKQALLDQQTKLQRAGNYDKADLLSKKIRSLDDEFNKKLIQFMNQ